MWISSRRRSLARPGNLGGMVLALAAALGWPGSAAAQPGSVGLSYLRAQVFDHVDSGLFTAAGGDLFASALAAGDFNGDGAGDLATGVPFHDGISGSEIEDAGEVLVRHGAVGRGLRSEISAILNQIGENPDPAEPGDQLGTAIAACDFDRDGFDDLAIGIPFEDHLGESNTGAVQVHYGSAAGLDPVAADFYTQSTPGVPGDVEGGETFGSALACGDFNADGFADLAIGAPQEHLGGALDAGTIVVIPGSASGLAPGSAISLDQASAGMDGGADVGDRFGDALAAGDFNGDGRDDLAVGVPGESFDDLDRNGAVQVLFGSASGLTVTGNRLFGETSAGGTAESGDRFGSALAAGDFDGDGRDDLAVGIPFEDRDDQPAADSGAVAVVFGSAGGLDLTRTVFRHQQFRNANDRFGWAVAAADFDGDGFADLVAGSPGQFRGAIRAGEITVFMGSSAGVTGARQRGIGSGQDGYPGDPAEADRNFGQALATGDFDRDGHADLAIGAPFENEGLLDVGQETVLYGSLHSDGFESQTFTPAWLQFVEPNSSMLLGGGVASFASPVGLSIGLAATHPVHLRHEIPARTRSYRARFYAKLWPLAIAPNRFFVLLEGRLGTTIQFSLYVNRGAKENGMTVGVRDNSGSEVFAPLLIPVPDGWRAIEVDWHAATPGQSNGRFDLTIDGHFFPLLSDVSNSNAAIDLVRWGAVDRLDSGTSGILYLDEYEAKRSTALGQRSSLGDTPLEDPNWTSFQGLFNAEVTLGCDGRNYCPDLPVTREQAAAFLLRAREGAAYRPPACGSSPYGDLGTGNPFCPWIVELTNRGITQGCAPGLYCPKDAISRRQFAVLLQRTLEGPGNPPPPCGDEPYPDVSRDDPACGHIEYLRDESISAGCGGGNFCPDGVLTRSQLAPLLIAAFDLFVPER